MDESRIDWLTALSLPRGYASVGTARRFVDVNLAAHNLLHLQDKIQLVVREMVTNALMHAQPPVILSMQEQASSVVVTVSDKAPVRPVVRPPRGDRVQRRGRSIVQQISDGWGTISRVDGGKSVWARFDKEVEMMTARSEASESAFLVCEPMELPTLALSTAEAAEILGVDENTVRHYVTSGFLHQRTRRHTLDRDEVEMLVLLRWRFRDRYAFE